MFSFVLIIAALITDSATLSARLLSRENDDLFKLSGNVTYVNTSAPPTFFFMEDGTNALTINCFNPAHLPHPGDHVIVSGYTKRYPPNFSQAIGTNVKVLASGPMPDPVRLSIKDIIAGRGDNRVVTLTGRIYASFLDEIDSNYHWLALENEGQTLLVSIRRDERYKSENLPRRDDQVELTGLCRRTVHYNRHLINRNLFIESPQDIKIISRSTSEPFDCPVLEPYNDGNPQDLISLPPRKIVGRVLATWQGNMLLMLSDDGLFHTITLADPRLPTTGTRIEAVGIIETDLYTINLGEAIWRPATIPDPNPHDSAPAVEDVALSTLVTDPHGKLGINYSYHGKTVRVCGMIVARQDVGGGRDLISLSDGNFALTVDASSSPAALKDITVGCRAEATGVIAVQTGNWQPNRIYPRTTGTRLVLRDAQDLRIISRPSWWTPLRLAVVIGILALGIIVLLAWNRFLNRLVTERSRRLAKEEIAHDIARLKTEERTRLAVELHDTIAQNLTGVSLQLDAAELAVAQEPSAVPARLALTRQRLQNCRDELRYVLWDLRSRAFEERMLDAAIRKTIAPHLGNAKANIVCDIPCRHLSDNAIHQILSIVRELVINAVRHGKASQIDIDLHLNKDRIDLSVADNGCGFDAATRPGIDSGHFGLQGLSERVHLLEGNFSLSSTPSHGTTAHLTNLRTNI